MIKFQRKVRSYRIEKLSNFNFSNWKAKSHALEGNSTLLLNLLFQSLCTCSKSLIKLFKDNLRRKMAAHSPATRGCIEPQNKSRATLFPPYIRSYISRRKVSTANSLIPRLIHENVWSSASRPLLHPLIRRVKLPAVTTKRRKGSLSLSLSLFPVTIAFRPL